MFRCEEEKLNTVLGEALLSLLEDDSAISAEALSAQLNQMLETETDDARRQVLLNAIRRTECLLSGAGNPDEGSGEGDRLPEHVLLWPDNKH